MLVLPSAAVGGGDSSRVWRGQLETAQLKAAQLEAAQLERCAASLREQHAAPGAGAKLVPGASGCG